MSLYRVCRWLQTGVLIPVHVPLWYVDPVVQDTDMLKILVPDPWHAILAAAQLSSLITVVPKV